VSHCVLALGIAVLLAAAQAIGQSLPATGPALSAPVALPWTPIAGNASDLSIGGDGAVFALDSDGQVWLRRPVETSPTPKPRETPAPPLTNWVHLPGTFVRIAAASERLAWAIDAEGILFLWNGTWWRSMAELFPIQSADVGVSPSGVAYAATRNGSLVGLDLRRGVIELSDFPNAPGGIERVDVDDQERAWVVTRDGTVHRFGGRNWQVLPGIMARDLSVGGLSLGGAWFIGPQGEITRLSSDGRSQQRLAARAAVIAGAPNGKPWIATADGALYANDPVTALRGRPRGSRDEQVFTRLLNWQRVMGNAKQLAISAKGAVLAVGQQGELWHWKSRNNWGTMPGQFEQVTLDAGGTAWALDAQGKIFRFQGSYWQELPGSARRVAAGPDGSVWIVALDDRLMQWNLRANDWVAVTIPALAKISRLAIGADGRPWVVAAAGAVQRFDGKAWQDMPEIAASELAVGPEGTVFVVDGEKRLWRWDVSIKRWERLNGDATSVAVGPRGVPWVTRGTGDILAAGFFDELPESKVSTVSVAMANAEKAGGVSIGTQVGGGGTAVAGIGGGGNQAPKGNADELLAFQKLTGAPRELAIGADGSVFGINFDGSVLRWNNGRNSFLGFPGQLARIAVSPGGKPWGVTMKGEVFRHDGTDWRVIYNIVASDIAAGFDGTVMVVGPMDVLYKYNVAENRFDRLVGPTEDAVPPSGARVALDPKGLPWVIGRDGYVARCDLRVCTRTTQWAADIDIGPEGSVFIVDTGKVLRRWNEKTLSFDRLNTLADPVERVAVGPRGKPWLINTKNETWSSAFFPRDESGDITTSATSTASTTTSTTPVFSFSASMSFDEVTWTGGAITPYGFAAGPNGAIMVLHSLGVSPYFRLLSYDSAGKRFVNATTPLPTNSGLPIDTLSGIAFGPGDALWLWVSPILAGQDGRIWTYKNNAWSEAVAGTATSMPELDIFASNMPNGYNPLTLAVGPDGTVLVAGPNTNIAFPYETKLWRYNPANNQFVANPVQFAGDEDTLTIDATGSVWVAKYDGTAHQYIDNGFVERTLPAGTTVCPTSGATPHTGCISAGAGGAVFVLASESPFLYSTKLLRWNAASLSWDKISTTPSFAAQDILHMIVAPDGRPWIVVDTVPGGPPGPFKIYKAR
jgi:hypothetical protein